MPSIPPALFLPRPEFVSSRSCSSVVDRSTQDSVINEAGFVELGLDCAEICQSIDRGMNGGGVCQPGAPILEAIEQLTT